MLKSIYTLSIILEIISFNKNIVKGKGKGDGKGKEERERVISKL